MAADPLAWLGERLLQQGLGVLHGDRRFSRQILRIAGMFQNYPVRTATEVVGWDPDQQRIVLPRYAIHLDGAVRDVLNAFFPDDAPGRGLERPGGISGHQLDLIAQDLQLGQLFWATVAAVIANIVAPASLASTGGIALCGRGAATVGGAVAEALGCRTVPVHRAADLPWAWDCEGAHGWPVRFEIGEDLQRKHRRRLLADRADPRNCLVAVDPITARALALRGGWHVIRSDRRLRVPDELLRTARALLPAYLQNLAQRAWFLIDWRPEESLVEQVLRDLARFVREHYGRPEPVASAAGVLIPDCESARRDVFADLLGEFVRLGRLKIAPREDRRGLPTLLEVPEREALWLSHAALERLLREVPVEAPEPWQLTALLAGGDMLVEECEDAYLLRRSWLEQRWRRQRMLERAARRLQA